MYNSRPGLMIGFHGCDRSTLHYLLNHSNQIQKSQKPYDWLGHGMYFWENNATRALQWAKGKMKRGQLADPAVIGAVLDIGYCCDFTDSSFISMLKHYYALLKKKHRRSGEQMPANSDPQNVIGEDKIIRKLDCTVIEFMHRQILQQVEADLKKYGYTNYKLFDSVRGMFREGKPAYAGAGIFTKTHVQICIRNMNCIKGFFLPRREADFIQSIRNGF